MENFLKILQTTIFFENPTLILRLHYLAKRERRIAAHD